MGFCQVLNSSYAIFVLGYVANFVEQLAIGKEFIVTNFYGYTAICLYIFA